MKKIFLLYFKSNLLLRILIGLILGAILGIIFQNATEMINFLKVFGDIFIRLLKMIVVPVIICTLIVGTSSISPTNLGKIGLKTIAYYFITSVCAIIIGLAVGEIIQPGLGLDIQNTQGIAKEVKSPNAIDILLNIIPTNPFDAIVKGNVLQIIFFCLFFGIGLAFGRDSSKENVKKASESMFLFFNSMNEIMFKIVGWIMQYAPIGVFALIFSVFSKNGSSAFGSLTSITLSVYIGFILQLLLVYCGICLIFKLNPLIFLKKIRQPMITAFVTRSSGATIPVSMQVAEKSLGVPKSIFGFTIPVGATINMDGTTIYLGVCAIFVANVVGVPLDLSAKISIILTAVLAAIGTAGVPGAGSIMLLMVLESVGLKVEAGSTVSLAYALILGIDAILDMGRTTMNVSGDIMGSVIVAKSEEQLNEEIFNNKNQE